MVKTNTLEDLDADPHLQAVDFFQTYEHAEVGRYRMIKPPVKFSQSPANIRRHAPRLGEHTEEVLAEVSDPAKAG